MAFQATEFTAMNESEPNELDRESWLQQLEEDPDKALSNAFEQYRLRLKKSLITRLNPRLVKLIDADDVLQDAFLAARQRLEHFISHGDISPFVWLRLIVQQTVVDLHRHHFGVQKRDLRREIVNQEGPSWSQTTVSIAQQLVAEVSSPSAAMKRDELHNELTVAIDSLSETDREVIVLRHFEELRNQEVAEVLGIEVKAASIRYVRALNRLKEVLMKCGIIYDGQ